MSHETHSVDELLEAGAAMNERADRLFDRLSRITASAAARGVEVRVNLEGRLISLDLSVEAMSLGPAELAGEIFRLAQEASAAALAEGLAALEPVADEELTAELSEIIAARPRTPEQATAPAEMPATTPRSAPPTSQAHTLDDHEDFSEIESWALPR